MTVPAGVQGQPRCQDVTASSNALRRARHGRGGRIGRHGLFPVNVLHNIVHLLSGVWGSAASRSIDGSRVYARGVATIHAVLTVMGLISAGNLYATFGLIPLYGNDIWLHALLAIVAACFGFRDEAADDRTQAPVARRTQRLRPVRAAAPGPGCRGACARGPVP